MRMPRKSFALLVTTVTLTALPVLTGKAEPIKVGAPAPEISLPATSGGEIKLSDFRGKKSVILVFVYGDT